MSKKRTRAQKIKAQKRTFIPYTNVSKPLKNSFPASNVKGQFENSLNIKATDPKINNSSVFTDNNVNLKLIKKDLIKSIITSSLILCLIIVVYLLGIKI